MSDKIPFYMTYPMQNLYLTEMEYEKDMERIKELYPKEVNRILLCIDERCDELEFEGSRIFDENPDRMMMEREVQQIYQRLREEELNNPQPQMEATEKKENRFSLFPPQGFVLEEEMELPMKDEKADEALVAQSGKSCDGWLCSLIGVLFSNEVYRRRCRYRRNRRWW